MSQPASKKTKRELELEAVPKPVIGFGDMDSKLTDIVLNSARVAYLAKQKGEVESWKGTNCVSLLFLLETMCLIME